MRTLLVIAAALVLAAPAAAWNRLTPDEVTNSADPALLRGNDGALIAAYATQSGALKVVRGSATTTLLSGRFAHDPRLVRLPSGTILLFDGIDVGVVRFTSTDDGRTWSGPSAPVPGSRVADVQAAAVRENGTPLFSQDGTGFIQVWEGLGGESSRNVFTPCCGYGESLALGHEDDPYIAFWSNATGQSGYLFGPLGGPYANLSGGAETTSRSDRVPLVSDELGNVFVAWATGAVHVTTFHDGAKVADVAAVSGPFAGGDPHLALATDAQNRIWFAATRGGALLAARSRSNGAHFGATARAALPSTAYGIEAVAAPDGGVDVVANLGTALWTQHLLPGLAARAFRKHGVWYGQALDDRLPVPSARFGSVHANAKGIARLKRGRYHVTAPLYAGTTLSVP